MDPGGGQADQGPTADVTMIAAPSLGQNYSVARIGRCDRRANELRVLRNHR